MDELKVISGSSNVGLSREICRHIDEFMTPNIPGVISNFAMSDAVVDYFSDGESKIVIPENMRGSDVFVIQSLSYPANHHIMELALLLDALKRSSCKRVTAVLPYYGYGRQDRKNEPRVPISAKVVADILTVAGIDRVLTMDLHSDQIQGFFNCPVDNLFAAKVLIEHINKKFDREDIVLVAPDAGGVPRVRAYANRIGCQFAIIDKYRPEANKVGDMTLMGCVEGKIAILLDDMIDTAGTLVAGTKLISDKGAKEIYAYATHGILSGAAVERLCLSNFSKIYVTNTIDNTAVESINTDSPGKMEVISVAPLLAEAIYNIHNETSVSCLFT